MSRSTLDRALQAMNPTQDETLLMRALVRTDEAGANAWQQFKSQHGDLSELFRTDKGELRRLSPLLARSLKANGADVEAHMWTVLRMASMREGLRAKIYQEVLGEVVGLLRASGVPFAVIRGAATGALAYGDVSARHSHDIDILVNAEEVARGVALMLGAGYSRDFERELEAGQTIVPSVVHGTSLPVRFHSSLFELDCYSLDTAELLREVQGESLERIAAPVLSAEVMLVQLLAHASYSTTRHTLQWVPDAFRVAALIEDWNAWLALVSKARLSVVVNAQIDYLEREIATIVPSDVRLKLQAMSAQAAHAERDFALYGARVGSRAGARILFRALHSASDRVQLAKWLALPSAEYLRWSSRAQRRLEGHDARAGTTGRVGLLIRRMMRLMRTRKSLPA